MAAITSYQSLKTSIESYFKRDDATSQLDQFIDGAEQEMWEYLRVREMEARATASTSTSERFVALPSDYISLRQLQITIDDELYELEQKPLSAMRIYDTAGIPAQYAITSQIEFNRKSDQAYTLEIDYYQELTALSSSNTTNDILTNYPLIYLYGSLKHAFLWGREYQNADYWDVKFRQQIAAANRKSRKGRYGPAPSKAMRGGMIV